MAPLFFRLEADVEEVAGVPTELNQRLLAGEIDLAPISSIAYARRADHLRILPRVAVSSEGAVDSIQLVSRVPLSRVRSVAVTPESATSVVLVRILLPDAEHVPLGEDAEATLLIGDAALQSAFEDPTPHHDLGRLWQDRTGLPMVYAVFACPDPRARRRPGGRGGAARGAPRQPGRAGGARPRGERALRLPGGLPRPLLREAPLRLRPTRARGAAVVLRAGAGGRRARRRARAAVRHCAVPVTNARGRRRGRIYPAPTDARAGA